ncbi:MAG TPA: carboxypeptidase regulatory-like domain-containing protein, partial [Blastocatellia bacterium]|nr:carboxypeptidase regulatory-like domain-containing protein [Blastocatellia bacterium]
MVHTAFSQAVTAVASGVCRDEAGLVVPGVTVTIRNLDTGATRTVMTDDKGRYYASSLPPGNYALEASREGFSTEVYKNVSLTVGREAVVDFLLRVGRIEERIEVSAGALLVETTGSALSEFVDERKVRDLPLNGRDIVQLIQLQMGVNAARTDLGDILTGGKGTRITVAGVRPSGNTFVLDGTLINNLGNRVATGATGQLTGVETIKEFQVLISNYSAEYSRVTGGAFNVVTRSGANTLHGSVFEFIRNDNFDARNFFDLEKPEFKRNQFGFSLGGPIVKNRSFFFGSYEGFRESMGLTTIRTVPDLDARRGILSGNRVEVNPAVRPYLDLWPLPTSDPVAGDGSALFVSQFNRDAREDFFTVRLDHYFSRADSLMARYTFSDSDQLFITDESFPQFPNRSRNRPQYLTLRETKLLSSAATNEFRFGIARSNPTENIALEDPLTELGFIAGQPLGTITIS